MLQGKHQWTRMFTKEVFKNLNSSGTNSHAIKFAADYFRKNFLSSSDKFHEHSWKVYNIQSNMRSL